MKKILGLLLLVISVSSFAEVDLTKKLDGLRVPDDKVSPMISEDKLHIVNTRYSSLVNRHEISLSGANNLTSVSHIDNTAVSGLYRYHINSRFSLGLRHNEYYNELTPAGEKLYKEEKILPDTDFALKSTSAFFGVNTFYGKMRLTQNTIVYFDQYVNIGYGDIELARNGNQKLLNLDLGFVFWGGKHVSSRIGLNNEFYTQRKVDGLTNVHNMMGYIEFGYLFGEGNIQ